MSSMTENPPDVSTTIFVGVDTHKDTHHVAFTDSLGRDLDDKEFPSSAAGHADLIAWITTAGTVERIGVEGTGSYGSTLVTALRTAGLDVVDVDRPDRRSRRFQGKSDPIDARSAARAALTGKATTTPKSHDGHVEAIRFLRNARRSCTKARAEAITQLKSMIVNAPEDIRADLRTLTDAKLFTACTQLDATPKQPSTINTAVHSALRSVATRIHDLTAEERTLAKQIKALVTEHAPQLLAQFGIGTDTAAQLLITVGDNPGRITTEAAFAHLCGAAPIQASSGRTNRHRLDRAGDRQANRALYIIAITRLRSDERTQQYRDRRLAEGKTPREIVRCLKRAIAREVFGLLRPPHHA